jgi:O-antigen ligase
MRESWMGKRLNQHNHFLNMLTEIGLMGFVPLVLVYFFVLRLMWRARQWASEAYEPDFVVVVWAVFAQYLCNTMFMEPRFYEFMCVFPFMLAGIIVGGYQRATLHRWNNNAVKGA